MSELRILEKAQTPDGIKIQTEEWGYDTPYLHYTIGTYPIARYGSGFIRPGEQMRISLSRFKTKSEMKTLFEDLKSGSKTLPDCIEHFWYPNKDRYYLGIMPEDEMRYYDPRTDTYDTEYVQRHHPANAGSDKERG